MPVLFGFKKHTLDVYTVLLENASQLGFTTICNTQPLVRLQSALRVVMDALYTNHLDNSLHG